MAEKMQDKEEVRERREQGESNDRAGYRNFFQRMAKGAQKR